MLGPSALPARRRPTLAILLGFAALTANSFRHVAPRAVHRRPARRRYAPRGEKSTRLRAYVNEIVAPDIKDLLSRPLLTKDEEVRFGTRVRTLVAIESARDAWADAYDRPPTDAELAPTVGCADPAALAATLAECREAREVMMLSNMRLVVAMARRMQRSLPQASRLAVDRDGGSYALDDLVAEGTLGLAKAVDRFEPDRDSALTTRRAAREEVRERDAGAAGRVRAAADVRGARRARRRDGEAPEARGPRGFGDLLVGRAPQCGAGRQGSHVADFAEAATLNEIVESDEPAPEEAATFHELRDAIDYAMHANLQPSERDVLRLRLGLDDGETRTRRQVGEICGQTEKKIRAIERAALTKLRHTRDCVQLREYVQ
ncbi:Sigma factor [Aureococcus anophagefferens]|nr:Sigma factor [Aureococcus anophagefferens]